MHVGGQSHIPVTLLPYPLYRRLGGHQGRSGRVQKISPPPGFCLFSLRTLFTILCPDCPDFCLLSLLCNKHITNFPALGGIRTRNPSKRSATDPRLRPLGDWNSIPGPPVRSKSLQRLRHFGPEVREITERWQWRFVHTRCKN